MREEVYTNSRFTEAEIHWLNDVRNGADVYGYEPARFFREVSHLNPPLVEIVRPAAAPKNGALRQPYFGAILTAAGRAALAAAKGTK